MIDDALAARARRWRDADPDPSTRAEVDRLLAGDDDAAAAALRDRFDAELTFGTAGLRGAVGAGPNRMNRAVVRRTAAAIARWLADAGRTGPVIVGRDARHGSAEFAEDTARVLAAAGREVWVFDDVVPTPVLAFAVARTTASAGVMVTASHNPPADNGYKVYGADGAQIVAPDDEAIAEHILRVGPAADIAYSEAADPRIASVPEAVLADYLDAVVALAPAIPADLVVAYTPMHGVGRATLDAAVSQAGARTVVVVESQADPDPDFPTVAFPNPEEPGAMDRVLELGHAIGATLVLANDPDADRLAVAVPDGAGGFRPLSGDEVGWLLADHLLADESESESEPGSKPGAPVRPALVVTTVVSSSQLQKMATAAGATHVETLTGFKWLARAGFEHPDHRFVLGYEEALGYSIGGVVPDKDGISAALVMIELAGRCAAAGVSVIDRLDDLARRFGLHTTRQWSTRFEGIDGPAAMAAAVDGLRRRPPTSIAGVAIDEVEDLRDGARLPPTDALILRGDGLRVIVRPSGTEPKLKVYVEVVTSVAPGVTPDRAAASARVDAVIADVAGRLVARPAGTHDRR